MKRHEGLDTTKSCMGEDWGQRELFPMGFRFRRSFGSKGLKINVTKKGLSSISFGGRGASINVPLGRAGGTRYTIGIPGSGMSWSRQEKAEPGRPQADEIQQTSNGANGKVVAAIAGAVVLLGMFVLPSNNNRTSISRSTSSTAETTLAGPSDIAISDVSLGPVTCTKSMTALQCESTGAFVYYTITNKSKGQICSIRGSVSYSHNGAVYSSQGTGSLFLGLYDNEDKCLKPGESWRNAEGEYLANSRWASGGYSSPKVAVESVETDRGW